MSLQIQQLNTAVSVKGDPVMSNWSAWLLWPDNVALSEFTLGLLAMVVLYAARKPMHGIIHSLCTPASHGTRFVSRWMLRAAEGMQLRNQAVFLAHSQDSEAVRIDWEFERVGNLIRKDLQEFPVLQCIGGSIGGSR